MLKKYVLLKLVVCLVLVGFSMPAHTDSMADRELHLKAAYVYNFTKFIEWNDLFLSHTDTFTFCVVDNDYFANVLTKIVKGRAIAGKRSRIINVSEQDFLSKCQLLYIHETELPINRLFLDKAGGTFGLTVGNNESFNKLGGMIRFYTKKNKLKFEINKDKAMSAGFKINSQLLRLGEVANNE